MSEEEKGIKAYVLMVVEIGSDHEVAKRIREIDDDVKVYTDLVFGEFDIVAVIEAPSIKKLDKVITKIRRLPGVLKTVTLVAS